VPFGHVDPGKKSNSSSASPTIVGGCRVPDEVLDIPMVGDQEDITIGLSGRVALQIDPGTVLISIIIPALFPIIPIVKAKSVNGIKTRTNNDPDPGLWPVIIKMDMGSRFFVPPGGT
jgi:hypothetical protein